MSETKAVYRTTSPENIARLHATSEAVDRLAPLHEEWQRRYPNTTLYTWASGGVISTVYFGANEPDMEIWRDAQGRNRWGKYTPRVKPKTKDAVKLAEHAWIIDTLKALGGLSQRTEFVGMPRHAGLFSEPGYLLVGGDTIWMEWGVTPEEVERSPSFDPTIWERMKLSDWHLMLEAEGK